MQRHGRKNNSYLFAVDGMRVLDDFIDHRWISISNKPKSTRLSSFPVLHDDGISNLTIYLPKCLINWAAKHETQPPINIFLQIMENQI